VFGFRGDNPVEVRAGETVLGQVTLGVAERRVTLPNGPFLETTAGRWVFVVDPNGRTATRRTVRIGQRAADRVAVLEGLKLGEQVIVSDYAAFADATRLKIR
jgi:HlyD family secretion protein